MGNERILPLIAIALLITGCISSLYVYANTIDTQTITINNQEYTYNFIQSNTQPRTIETFTGIALDDFIIQTGLNEPSKHNYTLIGSDGYQKTINWDHLTNGLLTAEGEAIFSNLPKAFRIRNIVEIKVIQ
jgi:hypothetical protein